MTTFNFGEADGTSLETIDSKWSGDSANFVTASGGIQPDTGSSGYGSYAARYENAQPNPQYVSAILRAGTFAGGQQRELRIQNTDNAETSGYLARFVSSNLVYVLRAGAGVTGSPFTLTGDLATTDLTIEFYLTAGGVLTLKENGATVCAYTDGTPLTGGFPGLKAYGAGTPSTVRIDDWTDTGPVIETLFVPRRRIVRARRRLAA